MPDQPPDRRPGRIRNADVAAAARARPAPSAERGPPMRLSWLARRHIGLWVWCERCSHHATLNPTALADRIGDQPVPAVAATMVCSRSGSREVTTRPDWPSTGMMAGHQPLDMRKRDRLYRTHDADAETGQEETQDGQSDPGGGGAAGGGLAGQSAAAQGSGPTAQGEPRGRPRAGAKRVKRHCARPPI